MLPIKINLLSLISMKDLLECGVIKTPDIVSLRQGGPCDDGAEYFQLLKLKKIKAMSNIIQQLFYRYYHLGMIMN
jgi:hypothetical protein